MAYFQYLVVGAMGWLWLGISSLNPEQHISFSIGALRFLSGFYAQNGMAFVAFLDNAKKIL
jgi:hypothetical protein